MMTMQCCASRSQCMSHAAPQREAGFFARFFQDYAMMDTILLVSIFVLLAVSVLLSTRIILAVLLAVLVILVVMVQRTQLSPPSGGV